MEETKTSKKLYLTAIVLYLNYLILGVAASILGHYKQALAQQWGSVQLAGGMYDASGVVWVSASLGLGCLIGSFFSGPLSDRFGRRIISFFGSIFYAIFFLGVAVADNLTVAYIAGLIGGIGNAFLNGGVMPAAMEIFVGRSAFASIMTKLFIAIGQFILPFMIMFVAATQMPHTTLFYFFPVVCAVIAVLTLIMPFLKQSGVAEKGDAQPSFMESLKSLKFTASSIALIIMGFTTTATFQIWVNCNQEYGKWVGMSNPSVIQSYYSIGVIVAVLLTAVIADKVIKSIRLVFWYPLIAFIMFAILAVVHNPTLTIIGGFVIGFSAAGGVLQLVTATVSDLFPQVKGTIISIVMILSSIGTWVGVSAAGSIATAGGADGPVYVIIFDAAITLLSVLLALFVNLSAKKRQA